MNKFSNEHFSEFVSIDVAVLLTFCGLLMRRFSGIFFEKRDMPKTPVRTLQPSKSGVVSS
jgi:hypothetical protein